MIARATWIAALVLAGCGPRPAGPFVRGAAVEGTDLVLERCTLVVQGDEIAVDECWTERRPLPVTVVGAPGVTAAGIPPDREVPPPLAEAPPEAEPQAGRACFRAVRLDGQATKPFCYPDMKVCGQQLVTVRAKIDVYAAAGDCEAADQ